MNAPTISIVKKVFDPLNRQLASAYPFIDAIRMDIITDGIRMRTELPNPRDRPSQFIPVQASDQALIHGWKVISKGGGIEPPTRGFSIAMAIDNYINTISYMNIKLVCAKVCF